MIIEKLDSGYLRAQGDGPCEWAQWPTDRDPTPMDFFPEASLKFRQELLGYYGIIYVGEGR